MLQSLFLFASERQSALAVLLMQKLAVLPYLKEENRI